jgi:hypothetical protein
MSLSLRQQLNNQNTELGTLESDLATLQTQTAEAIAFHHSFVHEDDNITILVDRTTNNASNITNLQATTTAQAGEIDQLELNISTNAESIVNLNSGFTAEIARVDALIVSEESSRTTADATLQSNVDAEATARTSADATLQSNVDAEATARTSADATLQANVDAEATSRASEDKKMCFVNVAEAEGLLTVDDYPFAFGFGSPSKSGFGLNVPFSTKLVAVGISVNSTDDVYASVQFTLEHYDSTSTKTNLVFGDPTFSINVNNKNLFDTTLSTSYSAGNFCIKVTSVNNLVDIDSRYRFSLYFQSQEELV